MMSSPEEFYEYRLKGKSAAEIMAVIRYLKREINSLIKTLEHPDYVCEVCPSEEVQLLCNREYLSVAKRALIEAGGMYQPTKSELKAMAFEENIPYISRVVLSVGGFTMGYDKRVVEIIDDQVHLFAEKFPISDGLEEIAYDLTKTEFLDFIRGLHIGEWRRSYDLYRYGMAVMDGVQWEFTLNFSNGHKAVTYHGDNAYPYNFREVLDWFDISLDEEEYPIETDE